MEPTVSAVADLFRSVHQQLREIVRDQDDETLNWSPGPDLNSIAVIVIHTLGSELDTLLFVRGIQSDRDRDAEFQVHANDAEMLLDAIDRADAALIEHVSAITANDLEATRTRPERDPQIGLHWLLNNYGHAREHLGHLHVTVQLRQQQ
ncbi:MAG: DUF1572 domain-containing protein [Chloroflexota bacterium]|nr:DUF1572 domain-containing protein [Chloroflexota bacterium]